MRKILILILFIFVLVGCQEIKSRGEEMYIAIYDRNMDHITNLTNIKFEYTKRVFDFDTSSFSGLSEKNIIDAFIFVLCENNGIQVYSGFVKGLNQEGKSVTFNGEDLRTIIDTEIILDYTFRKSYYKGGGTSVVDQFFPTYLAGLFQSVEVALETQIFIDYQFQLEFTSPRPTDYSYWIGDFTHTYIIANANKFLKPYLAYYGYYISSHFSLSDKKIVFEIKKNSSQKDISLIDFENESKLTNVNINKAIARIEFQTVYENTKGWYRIYEDFVFPDPMLENGRFDIQLIQTASPTPQVNINDYPLGYRILVKYVPSDTSTTYINHEVINTKYVGMPSNLPEKHYYLGLDNQIYEENIDYSNMVMPIKSKIFEDVYLAKAQYAAVSELVNNRYNENILLSNINSPIDLNEIELYTMINVHTIQNGISVVKEYPVAEIINENGQISINLGFKKTKFTEIIKSITKDPAIKSTGGNSGVGGIEEGTIYDIIDNKVPDMIEAATENISIEDIEGLNTALEDINSTIANIANFVSIAEVTTSTANSYDFPNGKTVYINYSSLFTFKVYQDGTNEVTHPIGTTIPLLLYGTGEAVIEAMTNVAITSFNGFKKINGRYQAVMLIKKATNTWTLIGALKA